MDQRIEKKGAERYRNGGVGIGWRDEGRNGKRRGREGEIKGRRKARERESESRRNYLGRRREGERRNQTDGE